MKTRNLVSSRRPLVGLVMVDAFWMIGEFFPRGRLLPSSTRAVGKLHSLFLIVLIGHANLSDVEVSFLTDFTRCVVHVRIGGIITFLIPGGTFPQSLL